MKQGKNLAYITTAALFAASGSVLAHLNIAQEDAVAVGDGSRQYKEGSTAFIDVNISHDCSNSAGEHFATTGVTVLMPNADNVAGTYTSGSGGAVHGANAIMSIQQRLNGNFKKNKVIRGEVAPFYNHGVKTNDARVLKWLKGKVDNDHYDNLEFKASFPKIDPQSCIAKIRLFFPAIQYCKGGYKTAWIRTADSKYGTGDEKTNVAATSAPYIDVVRTTTLPGSCSEGEMVEVLPSVDDINNYLGRSKGEKRDSDD